MKRKIICFVLIGLACSMLFAAPSSHKCPLCIGRMHWTGETKTEWGKLVYEMECPSGHTSWEVDEWSSRSSTSDTSRSITLDKDCLSRSFVINFGIDWTETEAAHAAGIQGPGLKDGSFGSSWSVN